MLTFFAAGFAVATLLAATGPILIHLFNRRRYRTVEWAAMDFLREALRRNRKVLQIRDLLILALRVLCVLGFGFALARPFLTSGNASLWPLFATGFALLLGLGAAVGGIWAKDKNTRLGAGIVCAVATLLGVFGGYKVFRAGADAATTASATNRAPVHAVLLVDNSLSMGTQALNGMLLDQAKIKAEEFIDQLPAESRVSVIPLCGSEAAFTLDGYRNREDALDALKRIDVVALGASAASASRAIEIATQACSKVPELTAKRVVLLSDQQAINWPSGGMQQALSTIPELQVVQIAPDAPAENLSIAEFRVRDGIADVETPASFLATIEYKGREALASVLVTLTVDGAVVASQTVEMQPDQSRQVEFKHQFDVSVDPGRPVFVPATVTVASDAVAGDMLALDNQRHLAVPVVAGIPIVFIDQYGEDEDPDKNRLGDTYALRRWLAPRQSRDDTRRQLITVRHTTIEKLDQPMLEDARYVVIAGVANPAGKTDLLRQFVLQGGRLLIAAGGQFDPIAWTEQAWLDGGGILPAPLKPTPVGETPEEASRKQTLDAFSLEFASLQHDYYLIEGESTASLKDFYSGLYFLKAIEADLSPEVMAKLAETETTRLKTDRAFLAQAAARAEKWSTLEQKGTFSPAEQAQRDQDDDHRRTISPDWLLWRRDRTQEADAEPITELVEATKPRALGRMTRNDIPFLVERSMGDGKVLFVATSIFSRGLNSDWNNLTKDIPVLLFDRIVRRPLEETLPPRNFDSGERIVLPVERSEQLQYSLVRPSKQPRRDSSTETKDASGSEGGEVANIPDAIPVREELLPVDALGPETFGVAVRNATRAGHYTITARRLAESGGATQPVSIATGSPGQPSGEKQRELVLAVNGPADESDLRTIDAHALKERLGEANYRWIERDEPIALEGAQIRGRDLWKWLAALALAGLLLEMCVLSWPQWMLRLRGEGVTT
jgi:hypothetical protein